MTEIIPAILTDDLDDFKDKLNKLEGLTDWVQIDIMDGEFVNNTSIKLEDLIGIGHDFNLEIHLMVKGPEKYFDICKKLEAKRVLFHIEAVKDVQTVIAEAKKYDFEIGISLNPPTPLEKIIPYLDKVDLVLFLAVNPGWQGQQLDVSVLDKIKELKRISPQTVAAIDGGVNLDNIQEVAKSGVDLIDVGSAIVKSDNVAESIESFNGLINQ